MKYIQSLVSVVFIVSLTSLAQAKTHSIPSPVPSPTPSTAPSPAPTVTLSPDTLRQLLLSQNNQVLIALQQVQNAKTEVDSKRAGLLPSVNASALLNSAASGPSFALSEVSFLLPFLIPDNWFALKISDHDLAAQESSYYILELNTFASAYGLYETVVTDAELRTILEQEYENYLAIQTVLQEQSQLGIPVTSQDLQSAQAQTLGALYNVTQMDEMISQELAQMQSSLGVTPNTVINIEPIDVPPTQFEAETDFDALTAQAYAMAPEKTQEDDLIAAAKDQKWSDIFSFIGSDTVSATSNSYNGTGSVDWGTTQQKQSLNFGFGFFTSLSMDKESVIGMQQVETSIDQQLGETIKYAVTSIQSAVSQYNDALQAEKLQQQVYFTEIKEYQMGAATLNEVIQEQQNLTQFSTNRVKSQADLNAQRISLNRAFLADQFANIKGCNLQAGSQKKGGWPIGDWLSGLFHPSAQQKTLDQMCKAS